MSLDLTDSQDVFSELFHGFTLRTRTRTPEASSLCGYASKGGVINEGDAEREKRWSATITLPARSTLELQPDEEVTIDQHPGRLYRIVHAPGPNVINLERAYGAVEV